MSALIDCSQTIFRRQIVHRLFLTDSVGFYYKYKLKARRHTHIQPDLHIYSFETSMGVFAKNLFKGERVLAYLQRIYLWEKGNGKTLSFSTRKYLKIYRMFFFCLFGYGIV